MSELKIQIFVKIVFNSMPIVTIVSDIVANTADRKHLSQLHKFSKILELQ